MINRFMISVAAAALIAGTGLANAQGTGTSREAPSGGSGMQQTAPSSDRGAATATPANRDAAQPDGKKSAQSEPKSSDPKAAAGANNQRAEDNKMQDPKSKSTASENANNPNNGKDMKAEGRDDRNNAMKPEDRNNNMKAEGREGDKNKMNAETKTGADSKTVGQAGAGGKLSGEQRTKISSVIKEQHVQSVTNVNFSISVGTRVPRDVTFQPLPAEVVTIYPEWRGYNFILVHDQIVVIDPNTYEIIAVIDA